MGRKIQPISNRVERKRIEIRVVKYLNYALKSKKKNPSLIESTILFIEGERQRAVDDYRNGKAGSYKRLTRLQHLRKAITG